MKCEQDDKVLLALYAGAMTGEGFSGVNRITTGVKQFGWALYRLQMQGLIEGCVFQPPHPGDAEKIMGVIRENLMLTPAGYQRAEQMTEGTGATEKLLHLRDMMQATGCGIIANVISRFLGI